MQILNHPAVDGDDASTFGLRLVECSDHLAGMFDFVVGRGKHVVAWFDLTRVDQRLAIETELLALE